MERAIVLLLWVFILGVVLDLMAFFLCSLLFKHGINQLGREKTIGSTVNIVAWYAVGDDYARGGAVVAGCCVASVASVGGVFEGVLNEFVEGSLCSI